MKRKITKNIHQYRLNLPIELMRDLSWDDQVEVDCQAVSTKMGKGILLLPSRKTNMLKVELKK
ncbi:hypothetical protein J4410_01075 [Candidatus Woesearchaeota archaeon]|nr:hypothetical protein [Candidatus Woesearchaeota archaeon]